MDEDLETCKTIKKRVRRAAIQGDTESLFIDPKLIEATVPKSSPVQDYRIVGQADTD